MYRDSYPGSVDIIQMEFRSEGFIVSVEDYERQGLICVEHGAGRIGLPASLRFIKILFRNHNLYMKDASGPW